MPSYNSSVGVSVKLSLGWAVRLQSVIKRDAEAIELQLFEATRQRDRVSERIEEKTRKSEEVKPEEEQFLSTLHAEIKRLQKAQWESEQLSRFFDVEVECKSKR